MDLGLAERTYIVTGATSGLGLATASELLDDGARVVVSARSEERLGEVVDELRQRYPGAVVGCASDNADPTTPDRLIAAAFDNWGRLDGVLINSGGPPGGATLEISDEQWRESFDRIVVAALRLTRAVAAQMSSGGAIAVVLSSSVHQPIANLGLSNGLRPGLAMAAKTLADELGPQGIRVVNLVPGRIATPRIKQVDAASPNAAERNRTIPLGRLGEPAEFGRIAAFVLSPAASYVTGSSLLVDGGLVRTL